MADSARQEIEQAIAEEICFGHGRRPCDVCRHYGQRAFARLFDGPDPLAVPAADLGERLTDAFGCGRRHERDKQITGMGPLLAACSRLLALKDGPRDSPYLANKPKAWDDLRTALAGIREANG